MLSRKVCLIGGVGGRECILHEIIHRAIHYSNAPLRVAPPLSSGTSQQEAKTHRAVRASACVPLDISRPTARSADFPERNSWLQLPPSRLDFEDGDLDAEVSHESFLPQQACYLHKYQPAEFQISAG
jgi:hypothetical protein